MTNVEFEEETPFDYIVDEAPVKENLIVQAWSKNLGVLNMVNSKVRFTAWIILD